MKKLIQTCCAYFSQILDQTEEEKKAEGEEGKICEAGTSEDGAASKMKEDKKESNGAEGAVASDEKVT